MKKSKIFIFLFLLMMTLGLALLSTELNISGIAGINSNNRWNVYWDNIVVNNNSTITTDNPKIVENATKVTYEVNLELPGDFYEFSVDAVNDGTINAKILDIRHTVYKEDGETVTTLPSYIKYSILYEKDNKVPSIDDVLEKNKRKTYKIRIEYDENSEVLPNENNTYIIEDEIDYGQTRDDEVMFKPEYVVNDKNTLLCTISGRLYTKAFDGKAIVGYFYTGSWTYPLLISEEENAVAFDTSYNSITHYYTKTCEFDGVTYYVSSSEYAMPGNNNSTSGFAKLISTDYLYHNCDSAVKKLYESAKK